MIDYKNLTKESILKEEIFTEIWGESDPMTQAAIICTLSDIAKELGVKQNFDRMLRASKKVRQSYNMATGGSYTDFSGDYPSLYCGGWIANDEGIRILSDRGEKMACSHPILPTTVLVNAETGYMKVVLAFMIRSKWREIIADMETVSSNNKIVSLSKYGVRVTSENARALVQYLTDIVGMNEKTIPERMSTGKLGWLNSKTFVPYADSVVFDNDDALSGAFKSVCSNGSYIQWLELMRSIRAAGRMEAKLYLAASFASPLVHLFNALPFIVSTYGKTGKGKTVALMVASSVWADPTEGKYFIRAKANEIALEVRLDFLNHLPLAIDDLSQIQHKVKDDFSEFVYNLCSGGGKERSNTSIGLQRQRYWKNIILTNAERSLVSETMNGGAINRIIEMEAGEGDIFESGAKVVDIIKENYGHAGEEFIDIIKDMGKDELKRIQRSFLDRIYSKQFELGEEKEEKQVIPMSIILTADKIVTERIFEDGQYLDFDTCYNMLKNKGDVSEEERAYEFILSDIEMHRNNFVPDAYGTYHGEVWGYLENGYAIINNNAFNNMAARGNFSAKGFLTWAKRNDLVIGDNEKGRDRDTKTARIQGKVTRCVFLKLDSGEAVTESENAENADFKPVSEQMELPFK